MVSFSLAGIFRILAEINTTGPVSQAQLAMRWDKNLYFLESQASTNSFGRLISPDSVLAQAMNNLLTNQNGKILSLSVKSRDDGHEVVTLVRIEDLDWIISGRMSQSALYAIPNRMIGLLIPLIGLLMLLGALGSILMLNPLTGKVILQAEEYELEIENQTKTLKELELANTQIDNILRSVPSGLLVCDSDQRIILTNQAAAKLFGFDIGQVANCELTGLVEAGLLPEAMRDLVHPGSSQPKEIEILVGREGLNQRIVRAESSTIQSRAVLGSGTIIILHDITKDRELDRMKSEFISTAAHELRTPLTVLVGYAEMLTDTTLSANFSESQKQSFLKEILEKGLSLSTMIDDLLDISRIESGQPLPLHLENSDLLSILRKVTQQIALGNQHHQFVVKLSEPVAGCSFRVDPDRIRQVMENLLGNAVKYSPAGSKITVTGNPLGKDYQITVADEGIGINELDLPKVFDKFFRADSSNTAIGGLGLGLSVVQKIVKGHGGEIYLESSLGEGTRVIFTIPIRTDSPT
ncbi:MAG: PAS domain-containing protein [Deltaproteobacteria bacterium]|nr:PAS domain-containing protein [Deltaproteobacteria bacterium]